MASARAALDYIARLVRWRDWSGTKLTMFLAGLAYAGLLRASPGLTLLGDMAAVTVVLCLLAAFGHLVNDFSDLEADRIAGKQRLLADWSRPRAIGGIASLAAACLLIVVACFDRATIALVVAALALGAAYSLPPLRLKERARLGWACATLAQRTLPMAIFFQALDAWNAGAVGLTLLATVTGVRYIIVHQLLDLPNDRRAGLQTAATLAGRAQLKRLVETRVFPFEIAVACATLIAMSIDAPIVGLVGIGYVLWVREATRQGLTLRADGYSVFSGMYYVIFPVLLSALLVNAAPIFLPVLALTVAIVHRELATLARRLMPIYVKSSAPKHAPAAAAAPQAAAAPPQAVAQSEPAAVAPRPPAPAGKPAAEPNRGGIGNTDNRLARYPHYARIRQREGIHLTNWPGLGRGYFAMRHADAMTVLKDPRFLKSPPGRWEVDGEGKFAPVRGFGVDLLETDPPDHTRLRRLVTKAFTPRIIERLEGRVEALANELLDRHLPNGQIELVRDYAAAIPIRIITDLLGVEVRDLEKFRQFTYGLTFTMTAARQSEELLRQKAQFTKYLEATFERRRREPRDDLITALVQAEQDGGRLSSGELIGMVYLLLIAGYVTTVNLIANSTLSLIANRPQMELLRGRPSLYPTAIEELLRYDGPLELSSAHFASDDIEVGGVLIPRTATIRLVMPSINRDPDRFERPDVLDLERDPCPHLAFGQGIHYCLGAPLARLEGRIALRALIERAPDLRLATDSVGPWLSHPILRGPERLQLRF